MHAKTSIQKFVADKKLGKRRYPRSFSNEESAAQGFVSGVYILDNRFAFFVFQVPPEYSWLKATKCTVILKQAFSDKLQKKLDAGIRISNIVAYFGHMFISMWFHYLLQLLLPFHHFSYYSVRYGYSSSVSSNTM